MNHNIRPDSNATNRQHWLRTVLLCGLMYFAIGFLFAQFARAAWSNEVSVTWNRLAFLTSAIVFAAHIGYEHFRIKNKSLTTAWHTAIAVALGGFGLALAANIHELVAASGYRPRMVIALIAWPLITGVPAFVVALVAATLLTLVRRQ